MLKFRMVGNLLNSSLRCLTEVQGDLAGCTAPLSAAEGEGQRGPPGVPVGEQGNTKVT